MRVLAVDDAVVRPSMESSWRTVPRLAGAIGISVGLIALTGWLLGIDGLQSVLPGEPKMTPGTAVMALLTGSALLPRSPGPGAHARPGGGERPTGGLFAPGVP